MGILWNNFVDNLKKSFKIGFIRYSLYNLGVLIIPMILMLLPWVYFLFAFVTDSGDSELFLASAYGILFSFVLFIGIVFLSCYLENCARKAYVHGLETNEKLGFIQYFKSGSKGYWSFFGKMLGYVLLPLFFISFITSMFYAIPFLGYAIGDSLYCLASIYLSYMFYGKVLGIKCDDFKKQLPNFLGLVVISALFGLFMLDTFVILIASFVTPFCLIVLVNKENHGDLDFEK